MNFFDYFSIKKCFLHFLSFFQKTLQKSSKRHCAIELNKRDIHIAKNTKELGELRVGGRSQSKIDNIKAPLNKIKDIDYNQYSNKIQDLRENIKEIDTSIEDEYKETSRFGNLKGALNNFENQVPISFIKNAYISDISPHNEEIKKDSSKAIGMKGSRINESKEIDHTLSLSNIAQIQKEPSTLKKKSKRKTSNKKYEVRGKFLLAQSTGAEFAELSQIEKLNNSNLSHSYDFFTNAKIISNQIDGNNKSSYSNNRYKLKQDISKSDLSASYLIQNNKVSNENKVNGFYKTEISPIELLCGGDYPMINPKIKPNMNTRNERKDMISSGRNSKSNSEFSQKRSSISRIFQPSQDLFNKMNL